MMYGTGATIYGTQNLTDWDKGEFVNIEVMEWELKRQLY